MITSRMMKDTVIFLISLGALPFFGIQAASAGEKPAMKRDVLLENKVELPGNFINGKVIRVSFPTGFKTPRHSHEGPGPRYVVKGTVQVVEGDKTGIYSAGDVFWESGQSMTVDNVGGEPAELIIFELAPAK
ncbi:MAG: cupin domain-containing protein [Gammaproteobacteria bacterium]